MRLILTLMCLWSVVGCPTVPDSGEPTPDPTPEPTEEPPTPWDGELFADVTEEAGIVVLRDGYGVAAGDIDGDGWEDLVFAGWGQNQVLLNEQDGTFRVATEEVGLPLVGGGPSPMGVTLGVTLADHDGDGDLDLFFSNIFDDKAYCNTGGVFSDCTGSLGDYGGVGRPSGTASFADFDADGDLDLYVIGGADGGGPGKKTVLYGVPDRLMRNDGAAGFVDISAPIPEALRTGVGFIAGWTDLDHDGDSDIYVVNDIGHVTPNQLFRNDGPDGSGGWTFTPLTQAECSCQLEESGMGLGIADFDRDGWQDLYTSNGARLTGPNQAAEVLLRNLGDNQFVDVSLAVGAHAAGPLDRESSWGLEFLDIDNDGWPDAFVPFGSQLGNEEEDAIMMNVGGTFEHAGTGGASSPAWGLSAAAFDYDRDGCLDLAVNYTNGLAKLYRNACQWDNHWLQMEFEGVQSNRMGIGVVATATVNGMELREEVVLGSTSLYGSRPAIVHFGLGAAEVVEEIEVVWPSGLTQTLSDVPADGRYKLVEGEAAPTQRW